jgi:hypothetical protein
MNRRGIFRWFLLLSILLNLGFLYVYFVHPKLRKPVDVMQPAYPAPATNPPSSATGKGKLDTSNFDFSNTGLSDEAWKLPAPELSKPTAPEAPLEPIGDFD